MNLLNELLKLLSQSSKLSSVKNNEEKNSLIITDIHNSSVVFNLWDEDAIKELRDRLEKSLLERFDQLILAFNAPKIKHFFSIDELKTSTEDHRFLFENNLVFFTEEEIEAHKKIIHHIQENRAALLLGFPATGKSIAVIDIAKRLAKKGYLTYYFSFKKIKHWPEIWAELKAHANEKVVFVLDDVHLNPETAGITLNRLENDPALNVLFISREIYKNRNFIDSINIYKELGAKKNSKTGIKLESRTVRTAQPNMNKKVEGIVKLYQAHYKKETQGSYPIGNFDQINKYVHKNLIVLNAYLKYWKNHPSLELSALKESELYQGIFDVYFRDLEIKTRIVLLQYLCIYYFEVEFHPNPNEEKATQQLLDKAIITQDKGDLYSIYHGEFALLLLKAFQFVEKKQFRRFGNKWDLFFANRITQYLDGFIENSHSYYPDNLLEILIAIPRFTKEIHGGVKDTNSIFKLLVGVPKVKKLIQKSCKEEDEDKNIALFLFSILQHSSSQFKYFFEAFDEKVFDNKHALGIYCNGYKILHQQNQLDWFETHSDSYIPLIIENSTLQRLGYSLHVLAKSSPIKAEFIYSEISISDVILKTRNANFQELGLALNQLKNIDLPKTQKIYKDIDEKHFKQMMLNTNLNNLGHLNQLKNIDLHKTQKIYKDIDEKHFKQMVLNTDLNKLAKALNELKNIDLHKTQKIYKNIDIHKEHFKQMVLNTDLNKLAKALNELKNIDLHKTQKIYKDIDIHEEHFKQMVLNTDLNNLAKALNELKNIDLHKTQKIYKDIDINEKHFKQIVLNTDLNKLGQALNQLKNIDRPKTQKIYKNIDINKEHFKQIVLNTDLNKLGMALNELKNIDLPKTQKIYRDIDINEEHFKQMILNTDLNKLGKALNELKNIDRPKTQKIYKNIDIDKEHFKVMVLNTNLNKLGMALNELKNIDLPKTQKIYKDIDIEKERFKQIVLNTNLNKLGMALNQLKNIDLPKTQKIYPDINIHKEHFKKLVLNTNLKELTKALNELKNVDLPKTQKIYMDIDIHREHFKKLILNSSLNNFGKALYELKNIDNEKTKAICTLFQTAILNKIKSSNLKYRNFIEQISLFSRVSPSLGIGSYQLISKDRIYQFDKLKNIYNFNLLAQYLVNIELSFQNENFIKVIEEGLNNSFRFLKNQNISAVSAYIGVMIQLNQNISEKIEKNNSRYTKFIVKKDNTKHVPRLIANIFMHSQNIAIDVLLENYQSAYPNDKITLVNVCLEIAKNQARKEDQETAIVYLQKAKDITSTLDNQNLEERIATVIKEYDLDL